MNEAGNELDSGQQQRRHTQGETACRSVPLRLGELRQRDYPEPPPIVTGLLSAGEIVLFIARQKEGKSTLAFQMGHDIAAGAAFLGRFTTTHATVLYIDYENRPYRLQQRSADLCQEQEAHYLEVVGNNLYLVAFESLMGRDAGLFRGEFNHLLKMVCDVRPGVLVIDPLRYALAGGSKQGTTDETLAIRAIDQVALLQRASPGMSTILVHHTKKRQENSPLTSSLQFDPRSWIEQVYGSQALLAHVDNIWGLEACGEGYTFATVSRSETSLVLRLQKDGESQRFILDDTPDMSFFSPDQSALWDKLPNEFGAREVTDGKKMASNKLFYATVDKAKTHGLLIQDKTTKRYRKTMASR